MKLNNHEHMSSNPNPKDLSKRNVNYVPIKACTYTYRSFIQKFPPKTEIT